MDKGQPIGLTYVKIVAACRRIPVGGRSDPANAGNSAGVQTQEKIGPWPPKRNGHEVCKVDGLGQYPRSQCRWLGGDRACNSQYHAVSVLYLSHRRRPALRVSAGSIVALGHSAMAGHMGQDVVYGAGAAARCIAHARRKGSPNSPAADQLRSFSPPAPWQEIIGCKSGDVTELGHQAKAWCLSSPFDATDRGNGTADALSNLGLSDALSVSISAKWMSHSAFLTSNVRTGQARFTFDVHDMKLHST